ncbi:Asp23/Gls24 family envelope stress response protein [Nonomuraea sp. NN258]|uniref:Asp23/Gls24 family envelope stress response protein n=1 Tax=Nonomuraea antri TaxID=2730852 RepID=UPI001569EB6B|nr:Asp23/Gls24 family envelope stress response protein [Nonomuraea antri]NRQ37222.1 Asp23/Gls24 family envelope stress response protein [Nonomuraea antri]
MTTVASGPRAGAGAVTVPEQRRPPQAAPERRGNTAIADRVAMKIACCAAREIPEVREVHLGGLPWSRSSSAEVRGDRVTINLNLSMVYPSPLRAVAARLREHVSNRVHEQTGLHVDRVDLTLTDLDVEGSRHDGSAREHAFRR